MPIKKLAKLPGRAAQVAENDAAGGFDTTQLDKLIGRRIRLRRTMLKFSQDNVASLLGITFQQMQKYENGENKISASRLYIISKILSIDIGYFFSAIKGGELDGIGLDGHVGEERKDFDPMTDAESVRLVAAYWKIRQSGKRKVVLDFITSLLDFDNSVAAAEKGGADIGAGVAGGGEDAPADCSSSTLRNPK